MTGNEKSCKIYLKKKQFFQNDLVFIDHFYRYHYPVILSTQITCGVMCVQHKFYMVYRKNIFFLLRVFSVEHIAFIRENRGDVWNLNQIWI